MEMEMEMESESEREREMEREMKRASPHASFWGLPWVSCSSGWESRSFRRQTHLGAWGNVRVFARTLAYAQHFFWGGQMTTSTPMVPKFGGPQPRRCGRLTTIDFVFDP